jgi:hypothetical protein
MVGRSPADGVIQNAGVGVRRSPEAEFFLGESMSETQQPETAPGGAAGESDDTIDLQPVTPRKIEASR